MIDTVIVLIIVLIFLYSTVRHLGYLWKMGTYDAVFEVNETYLGEMRNE